MGRRAPSDVLVVVLWLGLAASLLVVLEVEPPVTAEVALPEPEAPRKTEAAVPERVLLPPPPRLLAEAPPPEISAPDPPEPAPAPTVVKALKPEPRPAPATSKPVATVTPLPSAPEIVRAPAPPEVPEPTPEPTPETITVAAQEAREGRTLLRLLEHGSGPEIELAWPETPAGRARLFRHLRACLGMELAVMDSAGTLYRDASPWTPNLDRYSGFLRRPSGRLAPEEQGLVRLVRAGGQVVRLFPRQVDALLLGGLHALIGADYGRLAVIRGRYRLDGAKVLIDRVAGDGRLYPGQIDLSPAATRGCRNGLT